METPNPGEQTPEQNTPKIRRLNILGGLFFTITSVPEKRHLPALVQPEVDSPLCHCPKCESNLVFPTESKVIPPSNGTMVYLERCCPNCEETYKDEYPVSVTEPYSHLMQDVENQLKHALDEMSRITMEADVELFIEVLHKGGIYPIDFDTPRTPWTKKSDYKRY